jgi:NADH-quinone oxidoreductase subunit N
MSPSLAAVAARAPSIDWAAFSPVVALTAGACVVLLAGLLRAPAMRRHGVPILALLTLAVTAGLVIWEWGDNKTIVDGALAMDDLTRALTLLFCGGAMAAVFLSWRERAAGEAGEGEYFALLLLSVLGMVVLVAASDLVVVFIGFELLSIPLYILCATRMRREHSLESGLKYLIIGSVGSATLLYGLALLYGAAGDTSLRVIATRVGALDNDTLLLTSVALIVAGLAFKASVAPFHQWTPDVYEGAPTPVTGFMAVATKAAAFGLLVRLFDVGLIDVAGTWGPAMAVLAAITMVVGNVGAIGQSSLKRMLAYSSVGQAGYILTGVVVSTRLGVQAVVFYLAAYMLMNLTAFAVISVRERESGLGDDIASLYGTGARRPWLAWPMTISMLSLAGFPATMGFFGKIYLIEAAVDNGYAWLGVFIVLASAISLAYYLRVIAAVWMRSPREAEERLAALRAAAGVRPAGAVAGGGDAPRPIMAGGSPEADAEGVAGAGAGAGDRPGAVAVAPGDDGGPIGTRMRQPEVVFVAVVCAAATIFFGVYPSPLLDVARDAGAALANLV